MGELLRAVPGQAVASDAVISQVNAVWRQQQLAITWRRNSMRRYAPFPTCTAQALDTALASHTVSLPPESKAALLELYTKLPAYADTKKALAELAALPHVHLAAFSNGTRADVEALLKHAEIAEYIEAVVSCDDVQVFKPCPEVYLHARETLLKLTRTGDADAELKGEEGTDDGAPDVWLVSSNNWDCTGALSSGHLKAAWVQRDPANMPPDGGFGVEPTVVVNNLEELRAALGL